MKQTLWRSATVVLTSGMVVLAAGASSTAQPTNNDTTTRISVTDQQRARDFWTPERMRSAAPMELPHVLQHPEPVAVGAPTAIAPTPSSPTDITSPTAFPHGGGPWNGSGSVVATSGRVFFTYQGRTASCSGSAVTSNNKSTVITAGHCVKLEGAFHTNWVFVPAYRDGNAPYGTWTARILQATPQWVANENISYDIGAAVVSTLDGAYLTEVVGGQGVAFNQPKQQDMYAFGYPAATPYDGSKLMYCSGKAFDEFLGTGDIGLNCDMTGGASGGPWFLQFNESHGTGLLNSVNSFKYNFYNGWMFGPYFGAEAHNLYAEAQSA